jgi:hypothetical protein
MPDYRPGPITLLDQALKARIAGGYAATFDAVSPTGAPLYFAVLDPRFTFEGTVLRLRPEVELGPRAPSTLVVDVLVHDDEGRFRTQGFRLDVEPSAFELEIDRAAAGAVGEFGAAGEAASLYVVPSTFFASGSPFADEVSILAVSTGGQAGPGAHGGAADAIIAGGTYHLGGSGGPADTLRFEARATGGDGGTGGSATAIVRDLLIFGGTPKLAVLAEAKGGAGGQGGGAHARLENVTVRASGPLQAELAATAEPGQNGASSIALTVFVRSGGFADELTIRLHGGGAANAFITNVHLGGGDDLLKLSLTTPGDIFSFINPREAGSRLNGGTGRDTLDLSGSGILRPDTYEEGVAAVTVLLSPSDGDMLVGFGSADVFAFRSFENIIGTSFRDAFIDGTGDHGLTGGAGADSFTFQRRPGSNRIEDFSPEEGDTLTLQSFGRAVDSMAELLAITVDTPGGAAIRYAYGTKQGEILLVGFSKADLAAAADAVVFG